MRIKVMQSRLFNEIRAGEIFGGWLKSTRSWTSKKPSPKRPMRNTSTPSSLRTRCAAKAPRRTISAAAGADGDVQRLRRFNGHRGKNRRLPDGREGVADYLIAKSLKAGTVPSWVTAPYQKIHEDEEEHGNYPFEILVKYATTAEKQEKAARAVAMSLVLRRAYFDNLDRWVFENKSF